MASLKCTLLVLLVLHAAQSYGAKYNTSSSCRYYCAYGGSVYCCDDGSLTSESDKAKLDDPELLPDKLLPHKLKKRPNAHLLLDKLQPDALRPDKLKKDPYAHVKKNAYKVNQALKKTSGFEPEDIPHSRRERSKRETTDLISSEASQRSSRSRKTSKKSATRRNYLDAGQSHLPLSGNPLLSSFPFAQPDNTARDIGVEKITVNMSSLPIFPARRPPFSRAPLHSPFFPHHGGLNSLPHMPPHLPQHNAFPQPNSFGQGLLDNINNLFGFGNDQESRDGLDIGVIPGSANYTSSLSGSGGNLFNGHFPSPFAPFGPGSFGPPPFGPGSIGATPFGAGSIGATPFGPGSVGAAAFGAGSVGAASFGAGSVGAAPFGTGSVAGAPFGSGPFGPSLFSPGSVGATSFDPKLNFQHFPQMPFSSLQPNLQRLNNNETIEKSFSTLSLHTPTSTSFSPFAFSGSFPDLQTNVIVDDSITKAISPQLQPPQSSLRLRRHPEIPTISFSSLNSLTSPGISQPSITSGFFPFGSSPSSFNSHLQSFRSSLPSFSSIPTSFSSSLAPFSSNFPGFTSSLSLGSSPGLTFPPSISTSGLSFQNGLTQPIHEIHPLLRSSLGPTPPSITNKHNFGSLHALPTTSFSVSNPAPVNFQVTEINSRSSTDGNTHFKTSGFSSQLKGETVMLQPPSSSSSPSGSIGHPSPVIPPPTDAAFRSHTQVITSDGHANRHVRDHSSHGHENHIHHDHHAPIHHNHQHGPSHGPHQVHHEQPHQIHHNPSPVHSTRTESFSYIDAQGNHHIHFRGAPPSLPHSPQPSPPHPHPPLFSSSSIPSHPPPHPPPLSTHIRPPSTVLPLEKHHSTPELSAHPPLNLLPPAPPRQNRDIVPVPIFPLENSGHVNSGDEKSSTEVVLNIGEVRSRYKGIQEITLNIGESMPAISDVEVNEEEPGKKTLTVSLPSKKSIDETVPMFKKTITSTIPSFKKPIPQTIPSPQKETIENFQNDVKLIDATEKREANISAEAIPKTSAHKRPLSFPEDIPFFEKDNFDPVLIGDQIIKETDGPKFVRDAGFAPFRSPNPNPSFGPDFAFLSSVKTSSQPPLYYPKSQATPRPRIPVLQDSTVEAFKKFMNDKNLDFAFNDLFGDPPASVQSQPLEYESLFPENENPFHLIEYAKPKSVAEQIVLLEKICPCLARPTAFRDQEHCRCPAADRVAVAYRRTKREPYIVMTYKHFLIDRLALELEANMRSQTKIPTSHLRRPLKSKSPPPSDWTPIPVPGSAAFGVRDNRHIEDLFLISIPETDGRSVHDGTAFASLDSKGLSAIKNAIEEFVRTVEGHDLDYV